MRANVRARGGMLLEVVFALALLVMTAVFVMNGLAGAYRGADRITRQADAEDLAVTIASEVGPPRSRSPATRTGRGKCASST